MTLWYKYSLLNVYVTLASYYHINWYCFIKWWHDPNIKNRSHGRNVSSQQKLHSRRLKVLRIIVSYPKDLGKINKEKLSQELKTKKKDLDSDSQLGILQNIASIFLFRKIHSNSHYMKTVIFLVYCLCNSWTFLYSYGTFKKPINYKTFQTSTQDSPPCTQTLSLGSPGFPLMCKYWILHFLQMGTLRNFLFLLPRHSRPHTQHW